MSRHLSAILGLAALSSCGGKAAKLARPAVIIEPSTRAASWADDGVIEQRAKDLLAQMTLAEKIGQLNQFSNGHPTGPNTGQRSVDDMIAAGQLGSLFNITGAKATNDLQRIAVERSRMKIPLLFGFDVVHGYRTTFPTPLALAATWDVELVQRAAAVAAREAAADGIRWTFSPMVDITRDARWGRIVEGAGEDPFLGSAMARAWVRGYQGASLSDPTSIAACAKHYVGYGAAEAGRDYNTTFIPERELRDVYLPPFRAAVDAGAATVMTAFNALNGVPTSANPFTLGILKREWGFRGFVVSDWTSIKELIAHGVANDGATAARKAVTAGVDMDMESGLYVDELAGLVRDGKVPVSVIDDAVLRVLRVKLALGLFERPYADDKLIANPPAPADVALAKQAATESFVLLRNSGSVLPLGKAVHRIALIGPLADDASSQLGAWSGKGNPKLAVTLRAALAVHAKEHGLELAYERGTEIIGGTGAHIPAAVAAARDADVVILAVGENGGEMTGEASSRTRLDLPGLQPNLVDAIAALGKPTVMIVFSGHPLALTPYVDRVASVIQAWHPGIQGGPALVEVLTGAATFTGRLTVSLPRSVGQEPLYYNALETGRPATGVDLSKPGRGDDKYKSRYIDEINAPLFPFGYGLSYTTFEYSPVSVSETTLSARALEAGSPGVRVRATVKNSGSRDGIETAQLYIRLRGTSVALPVRQLKGFARIALRPGESRDVEITLGREQLAFWNIDLKHVVEPARLSVWIAPDAQSGTPAELVIDE